MVEPSQRLEELMCSSRNDVMKKDVRSLLAIISPIYKDMVELHNEMVQLMKTHQKSLGKSSSNKDLPLKALKL
eukprot:2970867-Alexandrium_andersonii.AAC.1